MATTTIDVEFRAKLNELKRELGSIPGITRKQTREMVNEWQAAWKKTQASGTSALGAVAKDASKLQRIGSMIGGPFGEAMGLIADGAESAEEGLSGTAKAVLGLGAGVAIIGALAGALVGFIVNLEDYRDLLNDLVKRQVISPAQVRQLEQASAAWDVVRQYVTAFAVELAANAAPKITSFLKGSVYAFTYLKTFVVGVFSDITEMLGAFSHLVGSGFSQESIQRWKKASSDIKDIAGEFVASESAASDAIQGFQTDIVETVKRRAIERADVSQKTTAKEVDDWNELEAHVAKVTQGLVDLLGKRSEAAEAAAKIVADVRASEFNDEQRIIAAREARLKEYLEKAAAGALTEEQIAADRAAILMAYDKQIEDHRKALAEKRAKDEEEQRKAELNGRLSVAATIASGAEALNNQLASLAQSSFERQTAHMRKNSAEYKKELKKKFAAEKALALVQIALRTAAGIMQTIASYGMTPLGIAGIAVTAALGIAEAAVVATQKPAFHDGGTAPDEVDARLMAGEGVLSRRGMAAIGGADVIDAINRGFGGIGAQPQLALVSIDGAMMDRMVAGRGVSGRAGLMQRVAARMAGGVSGRSNRWGGG